MIFQYILYIVGSLVVKVQEVPKVDRIVVKRRYYEAESNADHGKCTNYMC